MSARDTSFEASALQTEIHRRMKGEDKIRLAFDMSLAAREFARARIRRSHPLYTEAEITKAFIRELTSRGSGGRK